MKKEKEEEKNEGDQESKIYLEEGFSHEDSIVQGCLQKKVSLVSNLSAILSEISNLQTLQNLYYKSFYE